MNYEILYIIPAKYSDTETEEINKKIPLILEKAGASIVKIDNWGKKKLAYQIKHFRYGYYTLIVFSAPAEALQEITRKLNLNQEIIMFQIVKEIEWNCPKPSDDKKEEVKKEKPAEDDKKEEKVAEKPKEKKKEKKKASIDDLDKKLDELLNDAQ